MSKIKYNVLDRPKRSIHSKRLVITEEFAKLYGGESTSESDEDFVPGMKKNKINDEEVAEIADKNGNGEVSSEEEKDDGDNESSDEGSEDYEDSSKSDDDKGNSTNEDVKDFEDQIQEKNKINKSNKKDETNKTVKAKNGTKASTIPKKQPKQTNSKSVTTNDSTKTKAKKKKPKKKSLNQLKAEEDMNESRKLLEKFQTKSSTTQQQQQKLAYTGPYVKYNRVLDESLNLRTFIIGNSYQRSNEPIGNDDSQTDSTLVKIPKDKIEMQIKDMNGEWLCKLCHNRPLHYNLGDLYGPYCFKTDENDNDEIGEDVWVHESCAVWSPNIYVSNNKLYGLSNVIENSLNMNCNLCMKSGATIICNKTGCKQMYHYPCAIKTNCSFDDETFTIFCSKHSN